MSEEIAQAAGDLAYWRERAEACAERAHGLANEVMQERAKRMQAETDAAALREMLEAAEPLVYHHGILASWDVLVKVQAMLRTDHPGTTLLAVAEAAAAFVEAGEYDDLASLLVALKEAVARWER